MKPLTNKIIIECSINPDRQHWSKLSSKYALTESFIRKFYNRLDWNNITFYQKLSEPFIREFKHKINWCLISFKPLSEPFLREFNHKINWIIICRTQQLSESFIREYQHKVEWNTIFQYQKLSKPFLREFNHKMKWHWYLVNKHVIPSIIYKNRDLVTHDKTYLIIINRYLEQKLIKQVFKDKLPKDCIKYITLYL